MYNKLTLTNKKMKGKDTNMKEIAYLLYAKCKKCGQSFAYMTSDVSRKAPTFCTDCAKKKKIP